jgi:hypothetical protein
MTAANIDHTNLDAQAYGGVVHESVMDKLWDISNIKLEFTSLCSKGTHDNQYREFTKHKLADPATDNAHVDGVDVDQNDASLSTRCGNYTQTALKEVQISHRSQSANSIAGIGKIAEQIMRVQTELRRDVEAQMLTSQASVAGDGATVAGVSAGLGAWLETNVDFGGGGSAGGFNDATGIVDAPTHGTARAITQVLLDSIMTAVWKEGGEATIAMGTPEVIGLISDFLFSDGARVATMTNQDTSGTSEMTGYAGANVYVGKHGQVLKLVANRLQPKTDTAASTLYLLDPAHLQQSFMRGYRTEPLAKTGLSEKRLISVDYSLLVLNEASQGAIFDIDETAAMTAS